MTGVGGISQAYMFILCQGDFAFQRHEICENICHIPQ